MKKYTLLLLWAGTLAGCQKESPLEEVLTDFTFSPQSIPADGQSVTQIKITLPEEASVDRRSVVFTASRGVFVGSGKDSYTTKADFIDGKLIAQATLRAPLQPGGIGVTAQLEYDSPVRDYKLTDSLRVVPSLPARLVLEPSQLGLSANFINEVRLTGILRNANNRFVSRNTRVLFEDELLNRPPANGRFRNRQLLSNDTSQVSAFYGASAHPVGTIIKVRCTVLDVNGARTSVADSVFLTVNF